MRALFGRVRLAFRSLTFRWILVLCLVVLPINVLTAVITRMVVSAYEERIQESLRNQLKIYADNVNLNFMNVVELMQEFFDGDTLRALNLGNSDDSVLQVLKLKNRLGSTIILKRIDGEIYVWDKEKNIISFFAMNQRFSGEEREEIKRFLREMEGKESSAGMKTLQLENTTLLLRRYDFQKYMIGIVFDVRHVLEDFWNSCGDVKGALYLADSEGTLWLRFSEDGAETAGGGETVRQLEMKDRNVVFSQDIFLEEYQIVQAIPHSEMMSTLPVLVTVLYALTGLSFVALPLLCLTAVRMVLHPLVKLVEAMRVLEGGNLEYHLEGRTGTYQMDFLYSSFNHMVDELHSLITTSYEREIEKLQTDAINIRLQVNPQNPNYSHSIISPEHTQLR